MRRYLQQLQAPGLNPFFIRSIVQWMFVVAMAHNSRLNPFFIRSIVQCLAVGGLSDSPVLIPSSSGQSFNRLGVEGRRQRRVLIPSSSGQSFNQGISVTQNWSSLNPFFIRSIVQYLTRANLTCANVLIPSSSGQSFNASFKGAFHGDSS